MTAIRVRRMPYMTTEAWLFAESRTTSSKK
jgi:hypothetical protein